MEEDKNGPPKFATAINCMDGRVQEPVINHMKKEYGVDYVDMITAPGPIGALALASDTAFVQTIRQRAEISSRIHGSKECAVVGHFDCAGNPVDKRTQTGQIKATIKLVESWNAGFDAIIGLWVDENGTVSRIA